MLATDGLLGERRTRVADSDGFLAGKRCLVLDDEFLIALDIQHVLETAGATDVVCIADAAEALKALSRAPQFDLAVLDVKLGGSAGSSATVAAVLARQNVPFVFLTGMRAAEVQAQKFPAAPVVEKPYQASALLAAVRKVLAR